MDSQNQHPELHSKIICDKFLYQRLQSLDEHEFLQMHLFPLKKQLNKSNMLVILDINKSRVSQSKNQKIPSKEELIKICNQASASEIISISLKKELISELLSENSHGLKIVSKQTRQMNLMLKDCVILSFKLPNQFNQEQNFEVFLEGYKTNLRGQIQQNWGFINNGTVTKFIFALQNQKVQKMQQENKVYTKKQLGTILSLVKNVNILTNSTSNKSRLFEELSGLGQNYLHHQKFISSSNNLLPILNFEIELLCSFGRGSFHENKMVSQNIGKNQRIVYNICLNYAEGLQNCQKIVKEKIEAILSKKNSQNHSLYSPRNLLLSSVPIKLVNPHMFLKNEFKEKFFQYYTKGLYEYYHYGDQNFNDQGWGCAYRSLQTLISWFKIQQKLNLLTVPTIPEIQNLIDLIDCTSHQKLSNTNTWIGATEVSWVIKKLTGFDCRILHIKDGKDIVEHAEMFRQHLENVGTPIMYGGDEYAYSIVGINYSWKLGEIQFCILDPHYNGNEKIQKIIEKKGVCWRKPEEMFRKGVFYNFCLPIL